MMKERDDMDRSYLEARPKRRGDNLVVREVEGEAVVYDLVSHEAHCLNPEAARLWQACDGVRDGRTLLDQLHGPGWAAEHEAALAVGLQQLAKKGLLVEGSLAGPLAGTSRRELLARFGKAAAITVALPAVMSIVSPTPAEADSCLASNHPCTSSSQCCSGLCNPVNDRCA
jgi:hypothetical protein